LFSEAKMTHLLVASTNPGKVREILDLLGDLPIEVITPQQAGLALDIEENGATYAENAALKAHTYASLAGMLALGDDSGLEVDALGGLPGIRSRRFSPRPGATDADRRVYLLQRLQIHPRPWTARFRCSVALATPAGEVHFAEGECLGEIIPEERGQNGFGYDPIFLLNGLGLTMAELTTEMKNRLSHRARAIQAARPLLTKLITPRA
jgi:XTP/dITP diphosphohydrolase